RARQKRDCVRRPCVTAAICFTECSGEMVIGLKSICCPTSGSRIASERRFNPGRLQNYDTGDGPEAMEAMALAISQNLNNSAKKVSPALDNSFQHVPNGVICNQDAKEGTCGENIIAAGAPFSVGWPCALSS